MADDLTTGTVVEDKTTAADPAPTGGAEPAPEVATGGDKGDAVGADAGTGTLLDSVDKAVDGKSTPVGQWPEKWREDIAGSLGLTDQKEIDKELSRLARMKSPADAYKMARELERKMSSGQIKKALPENATPEQKAEWRKENGIPDKADGYVIPDIKGHEWTDDDRAVATDLFASLHEADVPQAAADAVLKWYPKFAQQQREQFALTNQKAREETEDHLRKEFGDEYRPNIKLLERLFKDTATLPEPMSRALLTATLPDGRILLNDPTIASFLVGLARQNYGDGAILTGEQEATLSSREEELVKVMQTDINRFNSERNAKGQILSDELLDIRRRKHQSR